MTMTIIGWRNDDILVHNNFHILSKMETPWITLQSLEETLHLKTNNTSIFFK
jgi:hypothetical protein